MVLSTKQLAAKMVCAAARINSLLLKTLYFVPANGLSVYVSRQFRQITPVFTAPHRFSMS